MSRTLPPRLPGAVQAALDATGLPYELVLGTKHWKLYVGGRMAGVIGMGTRRLKQTGIDRDTIKDIQRAAALARSGT